MYEEQNRDTEALLREQLKVMKKQLRMSRIVSGIIGIAVVVMIAAMVIVLPPAVQSLSSANRLMKELEDTNLADMIKNIDELAKTRQEDMSQTMDKLNQLDLESLNAAIQNLENTTRPLADLFGRGS